MLITEEVEVSWHHLTREHYEKIGYTFTKYFTKFKVKTKDLTKGCHAPIEFKCDYCGKIDTKMHKTYIAQRKISNKDCCSDCCNTKSQESMLMIYGVTHAQMLENVKQQTKSTCKEKYGHDNPMKVKHIAEKCIVNKNKTIYNNNNAPVSRQQQYIHGICGGYINYPVGKYLLDIADLENKIYIEYDGRGHNLQVKLGNVSEKEFKFKEMIRDKVLKEKGWKRIRIKSSNDEVPMEQDLIYIINKVRYDLISNNLNWVEINLDHNSIVTKISTYQYDFKDLINQYFLKKILNQEYIKQAK